MKFTIKSLTQKNFVSAASLAKDVPVLGFNGFSKVYQMTGLRLGYLYFKGEGKANSMSSGRESKKNAASAYAPTRLCRIAGAAALTDHKTTSKACRKTSSKKRLLMQTA